MHLFRRTLRAVTAAGAVTVLALAALGPGTVSAAQPVPPSVKVKAAERAQALRYWSGPGWLPRGRSPLSGSRANRRRANSLGRRAHRTQPRDTRRLEPRWIGPVRGRRPWIPSWDIPIHTPSRALPWTSPSTRGHGPTSRSANSSSSSGTRRVFSGTTPALRPLQRRRTSSSPRATVSTAGHRTRGTDGPRT